MFNVRISLRQRVPGEARNAIAAAFGSLANVKNVFVVDPDIDIFSDEQMEWALATRFQPDRDLVVAGGLRTLPLDPSLRRARAPAPRPASICTWPFGTTSELEASVPEPPQYQGKRFASVEAALADGPKYFEELMTARRQPRRPRNRPRSRRYPQSREADPRRTRTVGLAPSQAGVNIAHSRRLTRRP